MELVDILSSSSCKTITSAQEFLIKEFIDGGEIISHTAMEKDLESNIFLPQNTQRKNNCEHVFSTDMNEDEDDFCDLGEEIDQRDKFLNDVI